MQRRNGTEGAPRTEDPSPPPLDGDPSLPPLDGDPKEVVKLARCLLTEAFGLAHGGEWSTKSVLGRTGREKRAERLRIAAGQLSTAAGLMRQVQNDSSDATLALRPRHIEKLQAAGQAWYDELETAKHAHEIRALKVALQKHVKGKDVSASFAAKQQLNELQAKDRRDLIGGWLVGGAHLENSARERALALGECAALAARAEASVREEIQRTENYLEARKKKSAHFTQMLMGVVSKLPRTGR